jgi:epoxyqueuosine reductase
MPISTSEGRGHLRKNLEQQAHREGLRWIKVTRAHLPDGTGSLLREFINQGYHGDMAWLADRLSARANPQQLWPEARSAILFALPYGQPLDPMQRLNKRSRGVISVYALHRDYHDVFKGKLKRLAQWLAAECTSDVKVFVDTAPLMEKPLAQQAGLGWQGKHTNLVSRELGSWFFLGIILTAAELPLDAGETDHCGSCSACLDICPTKAFPAPHQLDARRCISYLTIEHKGAIAPELRKAMGNRIYGCDDCLAVCPWNKFAQMAADPQLRAREDLVNPPLSQFLALDDAGFRKLFQASPVKRTGRNRFLRNCLIAAGNSEDRRLLPHVLKCLDDDSPPVRAMAVWALLQLQPDQFSAERSRRLDAETDADVRAEWLASP